MRALLVDDEKLARMELRLMLTEFDDIEVVGEAATPEEAKKKIEELQPDLLFLDIMMPGGTGFNVLESLDLTPHVIFTTASPEFALKAFSVNALDYLMKPIQEDRLKAAVEKLRRFHDDADDGEEESHFSETSNVTVKNQFNQIFVKDGDNCWFVRLDKLRLLESEGNYVRLYFNEEKPLINRTLSQIESRLPENLFFRANRKQLINLEWVDSVKPWFTGGLNVILRDGTEVQMSRRSAQIFKSRLGI